MNEHTPEFLKELQSMPMEAKVLLTQARIDEYWYKLHGDVYISYSGGKDSTVLLDIARQRYPQIRACFSNTGLEYPEIRKFAQSHDRVETVTPKMPFNEVISKYGYPLIGKEVAEAIHYARKIVPAERERERSGGHLIETSGHRNRRTVLTGSYPLHAQPLTTVANSTEREREREKRGGIRRRTELNGMLTMDEKQNRERRAGVKQNGQDGVLFVMDKLDELPVVIPADTPKEGDG